MSTVFVSRNRKYLYHRIWIPKALRHFFNGREEVWRSLKTSDKEEARFRAHQLDSQAKGVFFTLRRHGHLRTPEQIENLVARWLDARLEQAEDYRASLRPISDEQRNGAWHVLHDQLEEAAGDLLSNDFRRIEHEADELLKSAGLAPLDHDSAEYGRLCRRLLRAKQDYAHTELERWEGMYKDQPLSLPRARPAVTPTRADLTNGPPSKLFSEVVKMYHKENPPRSPRSLHQTQSEFKTFLNVIGGDKPINHISKTCKLPLN